MPFKNCKGCGTEILSSEWLCRKCENERIKQWRHKKRAELLASRGPVIPATEKKCKKCLQIKPVDDFYLCAGNKKWRASYCKPCFNARITEMRKLMPSSRDSEKLKYKTKRMGTTPEWFNETLANQKGLCAICKRPESHPIKKGGAIRALAIDHDHITGKVRGLLCFRCNTSVHLLDQCGIEWAENAVRYMKGQGETC